MEKEKKPRSNEKIRKEIERQRRKTLKLRSKIDIALLNFEEELALEKELENAKDLGLSEEEKLLYDTLLERREKDKKDSILYKVGKQLKLYFHEWVERNRKK